jgi:predicted anti-sigma-YlaC factor YlaD
MIHLSPELLRRYRDEPAALLALEKEHLLACASCRRSYEEIGENASFADGALLLPPVPLDVESARRRSGPARRLPRGSGRARYASAG